MLALACLFLLGSLAFAGAKISKPNIILIIADGHGAQHNEIGRIVEYGTGYKTHRVSSYLNSHVLRPICTYNVENTLTDSAAAATAISCGVKTINGRLGIDEQGSRVQTLVEFARANGYATGIVSKIHLAHATPAGFLSHAYHRTLYSDIIRSIMSGESTADVMLGAGDNDKIFNNKELYTGTGSANAREFWTKKGYGFVDSNDYVKAYAKGDDILAKSSAPVLGIFARNSPENEPCLKYLMETDNNTVKEEPTLVKLMSEATRMLHETGKPFFLMVEQSLVDMASHEHNLERVTGESIEMEHLARMAHSWVDNKAYGDDLRVFLTADHATGDIQITNDLESLMEAELKGEAPIPNENDSVEEANAKRRKRISYLDDKNGQRICWSEFCKGGQYIPEEEWPPIPIKHSPSYVMFGGYGKNVGKVNEARHLTDIRKTIENCILNPLDGEIPNGKAAAGNALLFASLVSFFSMALIILMILAGCTNCFKSRMALL